ncbi:hypothetical protein D3C81_794260 [compost metagenome]
MMRSRNRRRHNCYTDSMIAKQIKVPLFVRIPRALVQRLKRSASSKNTSMSVEVTRVLEEGIHTSLPLELKHQANAIWAKLYKMQFDALETLILDIVANKDGAEAADALLSLGNTIQTMRNQRQQDAKDLQRELKGRQASLKESTQRSLGVFDALQLDCATRAPERLAKDEWRRQNLVKALEARGYGAQARLAVSFGCTRGYISQLLAEPGSKGHRSITKETARKIEAALDLDDGAIDNVPPASDVEKILYATGELSKTIRSIKD